MLGAAGVLAFSLLVQTDALPRNDARLTERLSRRAGPDLIVDLERLAAEGVPGADAMHRGFLAVIGGSGGPNWAQACPLWESASGTSAEAAHFTAECFEHGYDRPSDLQAAANLYRRAGEGGFPKALCALGNLYAAGRGVPQNPERAVTLCRRGAEAGDPDAQTDLGNFYLLGTGVDQDYVEARRWYERAAEKRQQNAMFTLGEMARNGHGQDRDLRTAGRWFEAAYLAGREDAAIHAARAALVRAVPDAPRGPVDTNLLAEASRWFRIAVDEDPSAEGRAEAAVALAQINGYEALAHQEAAGD